MQRLMKHAYLYATFSEEDTQLGAILVRDDIIFGAGWNSIVSGIAVSAIDMAIATCEHSLSEAMLVCPMPPCPREAALIAISGITQVVYHWGMKDRLDTHELGMVHSGFNVLKDADIEITEFDEYLVCFTLKYKGNIFQP